MLQRSHPDSVPLAGTAGLLGLSSGAPMREACSRFVEAAPLGIISMEALTDVQLIGVLSCRRASYSRPPPSLRLQHPQRVQVPPLTMANAGDESRELARFGEGG